MNDAERTTSSDRSPRARTFRHPHRSRSRRGAIAFSRARRPSTVRAPPDTSGNAPSRPSRGPLGSLGDARLARLDQNTSSKQPTARTLELSRASSGIPLIIITSRRVARATPVGETSRHAARARARAEEPARPAVRVVRPRPSSRPRLPVRRATAGGRDLAFCSRRRQIWAPSSGSARALLIDARVDLNPLPPSSPRPRLDVII